VGSKSSIAKVGKRFMNKAESNYTLAVKTIRGLMEGMTGNWFSQLAMSLSVEKHVKHKVDESHRRIPWAIGCEILSACIVFSILATVFYFSALFVSYNISWNMPDWFVLIAFLPSILVAGFYAHQRWVGSRSLAKAHQLFLFMADELGPMIERNDIKETITLIKRGQTLSGYSYIRSAAYLLDLHVQQVKTQLVASFEDEYTHR
jgi:hypothetical protein